MKSLLLAAAALGAGGAFAQPVFMAGPGAGFDVRLERGEGFVDRMLDEVDATASQREQIDAVRDSYESRVADLHGKLRTNREATMALDSQSSGYLAQAAALADEHAQLMAQMEKLHAEIRQQTDAVLTAEQRAQLRENFQERRKPLR